MTLNKLRGLKFYTVNEVSEIMQVRVETVLRWIYAKKIKASKLPGSRIWRLQEVDILEFMERGANTNATFKALDTGLDNEVLTDETEIKENLKVDFSESKNDCSLCDNEIVEEEEEQSHMVFDEEDIFSDKLGKDNEVEAVIEEVIFQQEIKEPLETERDLYIPNDILEQLKKILGANVKLVLDNEPKVIKSHKEEVKTSVKEKKIVKDTVKSSKDNTKTVINKKDIEKHKDGNYIANNKIIDNRNVISEFIFDVEQAKKPIDEEIVLSKLEDLSNVHICDDQEENKKLLKRHKIKFH
ncbi:MAG: helix-turn-helix domain-containing protein [Sarcina sp.]